MDRRVKKTKEKLKESLIILLKEKSINHITVKELTEKADVNRKTFYLHYKDIFDIIENIKKDLLSEFLEVVSCNHSYQEQINQPYYLISDIFKFIDKNSEEVSIFIGIHANADFVFINEMKNILKDIFINLWRSIFPNGDMKDFERFYSFIFYGFIGVAQEWIDSDKKEDMESITKSITKIILNGANSLN